MTRATSASRGSTAARADSESAVAWVPRDSSGDCSEREFGALGCFVCVCVFLWASGVWGSEREFGALGCFVCVLFFYGLQGFGVRRGSLGL